MIYIHKANLPKSLEEYTALQIKNGLLPLYSGEWDKVEFRNIVAQEQHFLCCYCNNFINLEEGKKTTISGHNATIEHFLPESVYKEEVSNYFNLFLACNHTKNQAIRFQHCDASNGAKAEKIIPKYISHTKCELFFAYNSLGEILPYCEYKSIESCIENYKKLTDEQKMVLATIDVLKLNVASLSQQRKMFYEVCFNQVKTMTAVQLRQEVEFYYKKKLEGTLERFCGIYLFLLRIALDKMGESKAFEAILKKWIKELPIKNSVVSHHIQVPNSSENDI